ncbi:11380_t:CDS:1 [Entrophospora sp. SA101]|nr:3017_t:CDS:1 [Entrophospora sp. SA101]CAJ0830437.1 11380_t:CDS:1 [Entrophospora sp. SA101]
MNIHEYVNEFLNVGNELVDKMSISAHTILINHDNDDGSSSSSNDDDDDNNTTNVFHILNSQKHQNVIKYVLKFSALFAICMCIPGYIWYIAVAFTTTAKLTAIFNTSCFWAYVFSILLLGDSLQKEKILAVFLSIMGVAIMTFWDISQDDNPSADKNSKFDNNDEDRSLINMGDFIALVGALAYGLNEVIYKKYASPSTPSCLFSNTITALIGVFTFLFLWIPIPILHFTGIEIFEIPDMETFGFIILTAISGVCVNASFMLIIAFTSPLFVAIGLMLTIPIVALVDVLIVRNPLGINTIFGGCFILLAFALLCYSNNKKV